MRDQARSRPALVVGGEITSLATANFALLGQYVEIPEHVVFTVECSVQGAMHAVYELLGIDQEIPGIYYGLAHPRVAAEAHQTALGSPTRPARRDSTSLSVVQIRELEDVHTTRG